jgi:hypothetical protein
VVAFLLAVSLTSIFQLASAETMTFTGRMHPGVEAGCWLIRADATGTDYLLIDPPEALRVDGLHVQVTGETKTDIASYCMQGSAALQITSYSLLSSWSTTASTPNEIESATKTPQFLQPYSWLVPIESLD